MVKFFMKRKSGDSIIEVLIAVAIFSAIAVTALGIMNQGLGNAQSSLETTIVRTEMDTQAERIRFLADSVISDPGDSNDDNSNSSKWNAITVNALATSGENTNTYDAFINNYKTAPLTSCDNVINASYHAFVLENNLTAKTDLGSNSSAIPSVDTGGLFVVSVKSPNVDADENPDYYDFYINTCWNAPGANIPTKLSTTIRIQNPKYTNSEPAPVDNPEDTPTTPGKLTIVYHWNKGANGPNIINSKWHSNTSYISYDTTNETATFTLPDLESPGSYSPLGSIKPDAYPTTYKSTVWYTESTTTNQKLSLSYICNKNATENKYECEWSDATGDDKSTINLYAKWEKIENPDKDLYCIWFKKGRLPKGYENKTITLSAAKTLKILKPNGSVDASYNNIDTFGNAKDANWSDGDDAGYKIYNTANEKYVYCTERIYNKDYGKRNVGGQSKTYEQERYPGYIMIPKVEATINTDDFVQFGWHEATVSQTDNTFPRWDGDIKLPIGQLGNTLQYGTAVKDYIFDDNYYYNPNNVSRTEYDPYQPPLIWFVDKHLKENNSNQLGLTSTDIQNYKKIYYIEVFPQWRVDVKTTEDKTSCTDVSGVFSSGDYYDSNCTRSNWQWGDLKKKYSNVYSCAEKGENCALEITLDYEKKEEGNVTKREKFLDAYIYFENKNDYTYYCKEKSKVFKTCYGPAIRDDPNYYMKIEDLSSTDSLKSPKMFNLDLLGETYKQHDIGAWDKDHFWETGKRLGSNSFINAKNQGMIHYSIYSYNENFKYSFGSMAEVDDKIIVKAKLESGVEKEIIFPVNTAIPNNPEDVGKDSRCLRVFAFDSSTGALFIQNVLSQEQANNTCATILPTTVHRAGVVWVPY